MSNGNSIYSFIDNLPNLKLIKLFNDDLKPARIINNETGRFVDVIYYDASKNSLDVLDFFRKLAISDFKKIVLQDNQGSICLIDDTGTHMYYTESIIICREHKSTSELSLNGIEREFLSLRVGMIKSIVNFI